MLYFFIHIDKKSPLPDTLPEGDNVIFIKRENIWWAGWSHVDAILRLIRCAVSYGFDYYILISGTDYPLRPNAFLYEKLSGGGEYINITQEYAQEKPESRIKYYYFDGFDRRNFRSIKTVFFLSLERILRVFFQKKAYPFQHIYYGSTYWELSHDCIVYVLDQLDHNKEYIQFYKTCWSPEESLFQTIIGNSPYFSTCKLNLTYTDWSSVPAPALINQNHVELFKNQIEFTCGYGTATPLFARKFDDTSTHTLELIEKELRN